MKYFTVVGFLNVTMSVGLLCVSFIPYLQEVIASKTAKDQFTSINAKPTFISGYYDKAAFKALLHRINTIVGENVTVRTGNITATSHCPE